MLDEPAEHTLPQSVFGLGFIGRPVGFLLAADERTDFLNAFGAASSQHLRHLDDPVTLQLQIHPVVIQFFQVVRKPLVPDRQQAEEAGFPAPCPPTRQSISSYLEPGENTRRMAPRRKCFNISST